MKEIKIKCNPTDVSAIFKYNLVIKVDKYFRENLFTQSCQCVELLSRIIFLKSIFPYQNVAPVCKCKYGNCYPSNLRT